MGMGIVKHGTLSKKKNIFWETQLFANLRDWKEGITFFRLRINLDRYKSEHTPAFQLEFTILNYYNHLWIYQNNFEDEIDIGEDDLFD
jgi:hypothetical protein